MNDLSHAEVPLLKLDFNEDDIRFIQMGIAEILNSGYLTMNKKVKNFEKLFSEFIGVKYAIGVNSGTSALEIILRALNVRGKSVIIPTITFMATPLAAIHAGAKVIFVDVLPRDLSIDPIDLKDKLRSDTAAIIAVHIGGIISSSWETICQIGNENEIPIIEDAAHAHGASVNEEMAGSLAEAGAFSFYPTKVLTTAEGGMITTNNDEIYNTSLSLREHGKKDPKFNYHTELGYNWRFSEIHALLGILAMNKCNSIINERKHLAKLYDKALEDVSGVSNIAVPDNIVTPYYKYILYLDEKFERERIKLKLKEDYNIFLPGEVYAEPCHSQPVFNKYPELILNDASDEFPGAHYVSERQICLPLYPKLKEDEVMYVTKSLKEVLSHFA